jgi:hypothetical protein
MRQWKTWACADIDGDQNEIDGNFRIEIALLVTLAGLGITAVFCLVLSHGIIN